MRTAKKVLSVILSVMIVVGTLVVAASAYVSPTDERVTWSLKAEVIDDNEGAVAEAEALAAENATKLFVSTPAKTPNGIAHTDKYKALTSHTYYSGTDVIDVKPGQIVWVTAHIETNDAARLFVISQWAFYSNNIFLSVCQKATTSFIPCEDSAWMSYTKQGWNPNVWATLNTTGRNNSRNAINDSNFHGYYINGGSTIDEVYNSDYGELVALDEDLVTFPVYVKSDAPIGATGQIKMVNDAKSVLGSCPGGDPMLDKAEQVQIFANDPTYTNFDNAVLNFRVVADAPALDYTGIDAAIASVPADLNGYTASSVATVNAALADAQDAKANATTQAELDTAATALNAAVAGLEEAIVLDYTRLSAAIDSVPADLSIYTTSTAAAVTAALNAAVGTTYTTQPAIDAAAAALENAVAALAEKADMTPIIEAIASTTSIVRANYTEASLRALDTAIEAGQSLLDNADDYADQAAVNAVADAIVGAKLALEALGADYSAVETAKNRYNAMNKALYTNASKAVVDAAIAAVQYGLDITAQPTVDGYAAAINTAIDNLVGLADLDALRAAYTAANTADDAEYSDHVWTQLQGYKNEAGAYLFTTEQIPATEQDAIDALVANIEAALADKLGAADYTGVHAAIASVPADLSIYTTESVAALNAKIGAVDYTLKADKQAIVDGYADDINAAIRNLAPKAANLNELNAALGRAAALNEAIYTAETFEAVTAAVNAAEALKAEAPDITRQGEVDAAAAAIDTAIGNLAFVGADFSALKDKLDEADALVRANYTAASLEAFDAAIAPAYAMYANAADYDINDQAEINAMVATATNAFALLVLKTADYTAVDAAEVRAAGYTNAGWYPAELWSAFQAAKAAVVKGLDLTQQETVDGFATALVAAMDALDAGILDGDYMMLNRQLTAVVALNEKDYTPASWAALQAEVDKVETGLKADRQEEIDAWTIAIMRAKNALVPAALADYSEVNAAIDAFEALDANLYTAETVAAVEEAIDAVDFKLNENYQDVVDAYAAAINAAIGALELKPVAADYTALQNAIAAAEAVNADDYTEETYALLADALAAGYQVPADLLEADQQIIDDAAAAINAAIAGLEEKAPVEPTGRVLEINYTQSAYTTKTYSFKVEGRAIGLRFIDLNDSSKTITLFRSRAGMDIKHYDADGKEVDDLSRNIAYEIWTTELKVQPSDYVVIAKDAIDGWEARELGLVKSVKLSATDKAVVSFEAATEVVNAGEKLDLTVVTGADVIKVQIAIDGAEAGPATFDAQTYGTLGEGQCTYNVYTKLAAGDHTLTVRIKTASGWEMTENTISVTAVK